MEKIKINETTSIGIYFETQISKLGRPYRLSGIKKIYNYHRNGSIKQKSITGYIHSFIWMIREEYLK